MPAYTYEAGLQDFADIAAIRARSCTHSIYGIEPGNDGNRLVLDMIKQNLFGLGTFKLVESSEQGMLAEVERAVRAQAADRVPRLGAAPDEHALRHALSHRRRCGLRPQLRRRDRLHQHPRGLHRKNVPNVGRLLQNLKFTLQQGKPR